MNKNIYYKMMYGRINLIRAIFFEIILFLSHYPSLVFLVFLRKKLGERQYTLASSLGFAVVMYIPVIIKNGMPYPDEFLEMFNWFYVIFILVFVAFSIMRRFEIKRTGHTFDDEKFSYFEGYQADFWKKLEKKYSFIKFSHLNIQKYFEPLAGFLLGGVFAIFPFSRVTGLLLVVFSILQLGRVHVQWAKGRHFILDQIDNMIANDEFAKSYLEDEPVENTRGFYVNAPRPKSQETGEKICDQIIEQDDHVVR